MLTDNTLYRKEPEKSEEWIKNYLNPTNFQALNTSKNLEDFRQHIIDNCKYKYIENYDLNGYKSNFYIPELNLALKFVDLFSHCELHVDKKYQLNSYLEYEKANIHIVQIFEDLWTTKNENIKSRLSNLFGNSKQIYARKCEVVVFKEKDTTFVGDFIEKNHLQGKIGSSVKLGLKFEGEVVTVMTFGKLRKNLGQIGGPNDYELLRFCNKMGTSVIGGASKLFKYFMSNYNPESVTSYADMMWSSSENIYKKLGLQMMHKSAPSYFYINNTTRKNRFGYRKDVLLSCGYNGEYWGEHDICYVNGLYRIYDVGTEKFYWHK
jgi:hypothetical protein